MSGMVSVFSSIILLATVSTLAIAAFAYIAYKVRERRRPDASAGKEKAGNGTLQPIFLKRHTIEDIAPGMPGEGDAVGTRMEK